MRVVVTGATGNVGSGVINALLDDPEIDEIVGLARRRPTIDVPGVEWVRADVTNDSLDVFEGADAVIHLAWLIQPVRNEMLLHRVNIDGSGRVLDAVRKHDVPVLVMASSVGAYSPGPKDRPVDETWPVDGIDSSVYSQQKAEVERMVEAEAADSDTRIVRLRTSLVFGRRAASEIARLFLGPLVPSSIIGARRVPVAPRHPRLVFQATHTDDVGRAYVAALHADVDGPINIAAAPVIDDEALAELLDARRIATPTWLLRNGARVTHALRLQPTSPGWVDLALGVPTMDVSLARDRLGWAPTWSATDAVRDLLDGMRERAGAPTPPLTPRRGGTVRPFVASGRDRSRSRSEVPVSDEPEEGPS